MAGVYSEESGSVCRDAEMALQEAEMNLPLLPRQGQHPLTEVQWSKHAYMGFWGEVMGTDSSGQVGGVQRSAVKWTGNGGEEIPGL